MKKNTNYLSRSKKQRIIMVHWKKNCSFMGNKKCQAYHLTLSEVPAGDYTFDQYHCKYTQYFLNDK